MKDAASELLRLKSKIEVMKAEKNRIEGELRQVKEVMKADFGSDDPKKVQAKLDAMLKQENQLRDQVDKGIAEVVEGLDK